MLEGKCRHSFQLRLNPCALSFFACVKCIKERYSHKRWGKKAPIGGDKGPCQNDGLGASLDDYDGLGDMIPF